MASSFKIAAGKLLLAASLAVVPLFAALPAGAVSAASSPATEETAEEYGLFLQEKLGVTVPTSVTKGEFLSALADALDAEPAEGEVVFKDLPDTSPYYEDAKALFQRRIITSDTVQASSRLSVVNALQIALKAAGLQELADTYLNDKAGKVLTSKLKLKANAFGPISSRTIAAAVDTGLLPAAYYGEVKPGAVVSDRLSSVLLGQSLAFNGLYKRYIGYAGDPDIYTKLIDAYRSSDILRTPELLAVVDAALERDLVTGYNIKDARYDANFVDSRSLVYGHSDLKHALQLIGLLRSEGVEAKVQFEPKTSAFVYLKEWGDPGTSDLYEVRQIANGNYIQYAKEYDIAFEFESAADKARFNNIVLTYAKKNSEDQAGLIANSWWQPLYYSLTELDGYELITNNKIASGHYYAQSFSLKEKSADVVAGFKQVDPDVQVETYDFWADAPFYRYLNGEST